MEYNLSGFISIFSIERLFCQLNKVVLLDLFCTHTTLYFILYPIYDLNNMQSPGRRKFLKWISVYWNWCFSQMTTQYFCRTNIIFTKIDVSLCCIINTFLLFLRNTQSSKKNISGIEGLHSHTSDEAMNICATRTIKWSEVTSQWLVANFILHQLTSAYFCKKFNAEIDNPNNSWHGWS